LQEKKAKEKYNKVWLECKNPNKESKEEREISGCY
jgi:hypothetical protein